MEYTQEIFDRQSGEMLTLSMGNWITITELGEMLGAGARKTRSILLKMEFLQIEGTATKTRHRLCPWVVERGWGKRIETNRSRPFDVVGPEGQTWVAGRWCKVVAELEASKSALSLVAAEALRRFMEVRLRPLPLEGMVCWFADNFPTLTQSEIASILTVTQPLVQRYLQRRSDRRAALRLGKTATLASKPRRPGWVDASEREGLPERW